MEILRPGPYSYLLNPIELLWSSLKKFTKASLRKRMKMVMCGVSSKRITLIEVRMQTLEQFAQTSITKAVTESGFQNYADRVERY